MYLCICIYMHIQLLTCGGDQVSGRRGEGSAELVEGPQNLLCDRALQPVSERGGNLLTRGSKSVQGTPEADEEKNVKGSHNQPVKALNSILTTRFPDDEEEELQSARNGKLLTGGGDGVFIERYASHLLPLVAASLADEEV